MKQHVTCKIHLSGIGLESFATPPPAGFRPPFRTVGPTRSTVRPKNVARLKNFSHFCPIPEAAGRSPETMAGIYLHIPFCKRICSYCDFYKSVRTELIDAVTARMHRELTERSGYLHDRRIETVYFGGGTPRSAGRSSWGTHRPHPRRVRLLGPLRDHRRGEPRRPHARLSGGAAARRHRPTVHRHPVLRRPGTPVHEPPPRLRSRPTGSRGGPPGRLPQPDYRPDLRRSGIRRRHPAAQPGADAGAAPPAHLRLPPDHRARHRLRPPSPAGRTAGRRGGGERGGVPDRPRHPDGGRIRTLRGLELRPARLPGPPQLRLLERPGISGHRSAAHSFDGRSRRWSTDTAESYAAGGP